MVQQNLAKFIKGLVHQCRVWNFLCLARIQLQISALRKNKTRNILSHATLTIRWMFAWQHNIKHV